MRRIPALILLITIYISTLGQSTPCNEAKKVVALLNKQHISPIGLNDSLSSRIFNLTFQNLDPHQIYFSATDFEDFLPKKHLLDDEIANGKCTFSEEITKIYKKRLETTLVYLSALKNEITNFDENDDYISYPKESFVFPKNERHRLKRIAQRVKFLTLKRLIYRHYHDSLAVFPQAAIDAIQNTKSEVIDQWICQINHLLIHEDGFNTHIAEEFLNAITKSYDPHSAYFNHRKKKEFDLHLSRENETFGLYFEMTDNGDFVVADLSPGGPAWKSNLIHEKDVLEELIWPNGNKEDITCATEAELNNLLNTSPFKTITLQLKKQDGKLVSTFLKKEVLRVDENTIKSFVIHEEKKIAYLSIPSFYADEGGATIQGCANDVAKEVIKLKREHIDGLILDLRNNGGGSLREAIDFAGIFIDEGPICLMKEKNSGTQLIKDFNRGSIYDGPLVVLINEFTASAAEILASSLQDYNRAVIVGSNSFGKATGQIIVPIETNSDNLATVLSVANSHRAYIKFTNSLFYRVNQTSNQITGISPDISLPSIWKKNQLKEKDLHYVLENKRSNKEVLIKKYPTLPIHQLKTKSNQRMLHDSNLIALNNIATKFEKEKPRTNPLSINKFWDNNYTEIRLMDKFHAFSKTEKSLLTVKNNSSDAIFIEMDQLINSINNKIINDLEKNVLIYETYHIISDLIDTMNNQK